MYHTHQVDSMIVKLANYSTNSEHEVKLMRTMVRAYCKTTFKRIADSVCINVIERTFFRKGIDQMVELLSSIDVSKYRESVSVTNKREELSHTIEVLNSAVIYL